MPIARIIDREDTDVANIVTFHMIQLTPHVERRAVAKDLAEKMWPGAFISLDSMEVLSTSNAELSWMQHICQPRRLHGYAVRLKVERAIQEFFDQRGFLATRTPLLVPAPGTDPLCPAFKVHGKNGSQYYLPGSPEFAMKKLLAAGLGPIYQLSQAFRDEPASATHLPEFTMLEWYRAGTLQDIMNDMESLCQSVAKSLFGDTYCLQDDTKIRLDGPWPKVRMETLFKNIGIDLMHDDLIMHAKKLGLMPNDSWDDTFFLIFLNCIEPKLPKTPLFITHYPASQAALAKIVHDNGTWADRFECYIGGVELANAFHELTDVKEQEARFIQELAPPDDLLLQALEEGIPPSSGIALGVDRLIMFMAGESDIHFTQLLGPHNTPKVTWKRR